jgi:hypothetical protein
MRLVLTSALTLGVIASAIVTSPALAQTPNIEGSYRLVSRTLKDGTVIKPPEIVGLQTYTKEYRNFNISFKDPEGKMISRSLIATYTLTPTEYTEKPLFHIYVQGNEIRNAIDESARSKVTIDGQRISFPNARRQIVHELGGFTSTSPENTDIWEKVQ